MLCMRWHVRLRFKAVAKESSALKLLTMSSGGRTVSVAAGGCEVAIDMDESGMAECCIFGDLL